MIALLLRLYPARWRERYGNEFASVLEQRSLGPFDVVDILLGALDAHLHAPGLAAVSHDQMGFPMSLRVGGYAAIVGGLLFFTGFLANALDGSDDAWPTAGIILAGILALLFAMAGLSAHQARRHPALVWAAFLVPTLGGVVASVGTVLMALAPDASWVPLSPWGLAMLGLATLMAGSGLFAYATWRTGMMSQAGTALLGFAGLLVIPGIVGILGAWPWEPLAWVAPLAILISFAAGWLLTGIAAVRADRAAA